MSIGNLLEVLSQRILVGIILGGRSGVRSGSAAAAAAAPGLGLRARGSGLGLGRGRGLDQEPARRARRSSAGRSNAGRRGGRPDRDGSNAEEAGSNAGADSDEEAGRPPSMHAGRADSSCEPWRGGCSLTSARRLLLANPRNEWSHRCSY